MGRPSGPAPKPLQLKALQGGRLSDLQRKAGGGVVAPPGVPEMPAGLDGEAAAEWHRVIAELEPLGLVSLVDRGMLTLMCESWGLYRRAHEAIAGDSWVNEHGQVAAAVTVRNKAWDQYVKIAAEFGMSASSRSRVSVSPKPKRSKWADV